MEVICKPYLAGILKNVFEFHCTQEIDAKILEVASKLKGIECVHPWNKRTQRYHFSFTIGDAFDNETVCLNLQAEIIKILK